MKTFICFDRDGTLLYDDKYYLGRSNNWKSQMKFLPKVVQGLKLMQKKLDAKFYILTHQKGVAIKDYPLLTRERANKVCEETIIRLNKKGVRMDGYVVCGKVNPAYVKKDLKFDKKLVGNFSCIKPKIGMVNEMLKMENVKKAKIYMVGDRYVDVKMGLNAKGCGIIVPFKNEVGEVEKVRKINSKKVCVAKDMVEAAKFIIKSEIK